MRTITIPRSRKLGFSMIPLIDVVFLLIIFFLVSSHLAQTETRVPLELPTAASGDRDLDFQTPRLTINVTEDGQVWLGGRVIQSDQLPQRLQAVRETEGDDLEVRIRCSRLTPYHQVEPIMLACTQAGIWNVSYAVYRPEDR